VRVLRFLLRKEYLQIFRDRLMVVQMLLLPCIPQEPPKAGGLDLAPLLPFLRKHCFECHAEGTRKGGLDFDKLSANLADPELHRRWIAIHDRVQSGEMPPAKSPRPASDEIAAFLRPLAKSLSDADRARPRGVLRRLNRVEYENTVRHLLGITAEALAPRRIRLQRILFFADPNGVPRAGTEIRHQSEDWEFDAAFLYDFVAPQTWQVKDLRSTPGLWTRRVTNLDDGLRYQCAAPWSTDTAYPDWSCRNYAPIPGRESRDMSRSDYNALDRHTRVVAYGNSWLERQDNIKTIHGDAGRIPLARETGNVEDLGGRDLGLEAGDMDDRVHWNDSTLFAGLRPGA